MNKIPIKQIVVVEGKYDKIALENVIDAEIFSCDGFGIYKNGPQKKALRSLALEHGAIILTDSDHAGGQLRSYLSSILQGAEIHTLYIPAVKGKEKRKAVPSKEGYLGVEGMNAKILRRLFSEFRAEPADEIFQARDLFFYQLTGVPGAKERKEKLLRALSLPPGLSNRALLKELNRRFTQETLEAFLTEMLEKDEN